MTLSKIRKAELARQARRYGYLQFGYRLEVDCPLRCGERITADYSPALGSKLRQLDAAVIGHLDGCPRQPTNRPTTGSSQPRSSR